MPQFEATARPRDPDALIVLDDGRVHAHVGPLALYVGVFGALIGLTLLTVAASNVHLGSANFIVAIAIASMKAALVLLFFMHLQSDHKFHGMVLVVSIVFIAVFFAYTLNDTGRRGEIDSQQGVGVDPATGDVAPGGIPQQY